MEIKEVLESREKKLLLKIKFSSRILDEYDRAAEIHPSLHSLHEAYAVLLEEMDELWQLIKIKPYRIKQIQTEAIQVGAMALRLLVDCIGEDDAESTEE